MTMGTRGYRAYRYKRRYLVRLNRSGSEPARFGHDVRRKIPRSGVSKENFEEWVKTTQDYFDAKFERLHSDIEKDEFVADQMPNFPYFRWVYEIDLDNLVFLVNYVPIFRLDNMPPSKVFVKCISHDHFGQLASHELTPFQYRYNWRAPPPYPPPESLTAYESCPNRSSTSPIHELLGTPCDTHGVVIDRTCSYSTRRASDDAIYGRTPYRFPSSLH